MPITRELTEEELAELSALGRNPDLYRGKAITMYEKGELDKPEEHSTLGDAAKGFGSAVIPTLGAGAGAALALTALSLAAIPVTGGASLLPLLAGIGGGVAGGMGAGALQDALMPEVWKEELAKANERSPWATKAGQIATLPLGGFNPSKDVVKAIDYAGSKLIGYMPGVGGRQALLNTGVGTGIGAVQEGVMQKLRGEDLSASGIAEGALTGAIFNKPNIIGTRVFKFADVPKPDAVVRGDVDLIANYRPESKPTVVPEPLTSEARLTLKQQREQTANLLGAKYAEEMRQRHAANKGEVKQAEEGVQQKNLAHPAIAQLDALLKERGLSGSAHPDAWKQRAATHGITIKEGPLKGRVRGEISADRQTVTLDPTKATADTPPHEIGHDVLEGLPKNLRAKFEQLVQPKLDALNAQRLELGQKPIKDADEYLALQLGARSVERSLAGENMGAGNRWKDIKASLKNIFSEADLESLEREALARIVEGDAPLKQQVTDVGNVEEGVKEGGEGSGRFEVFTAEEKKARNRERARVGMAARRAAEVTVKRPEGRRFITDPANRAKTSLLEHKDNDEAFKRSLGRSINDVKAKSQGENVLRYIQEADAQDIIANAKANIQEHGLDMGKDGLPDLDGTIQRRVRDSLDLAIKDYKENRQGKVSFDKQVNDKQTVGDLISTDKVIEATPEPVEEATPATELEAKPVIKQEQPTVTKSSSAPVPVAQLMDKLEPQLNNVRIPQENRAKMKALYDELDQMLEEDNFAEVDVQEMMEKHGLTKQATEGLNPDWRQDQKEEMEQLYGKRTTTKEVSKPSPQRTPYDPERFRRLRQEAGLEEPKKADEGVEKGEVFTTKAVSILEKPKAGLMNAGKAFNGSQLHGYLKNELTPVEFDILEKQGLKDRFEGKIVSQKDAIDWVKEHQPKVEIHSYGQRGKVSKEKAELDLLTHEWFDTLTSEQKQFVNERVRLRITNETGMFHSKNLERLNDPKEREIYNKYLKLSEKVTQDSYKDNGPRATSAYNTVSPKDTKTHPIVRVDVVIPQKELKLTGEMAQIVPPNYGKGLDGKHREYPIWQQDNLHENLPNTLGWAAIQYETVGDSKIAHIFEAQSRWGQERRKQVSEYGKEMPELIEAPDHPLLKDYNRLILKATIEQARKDGATHIAISDGETAMMSEGHDAVATGKLVLPEDKITDAKRDGWNTQDGVLTGNVGMLEQAKAKYGGVLTSEVSQEQGMRLNYDKILPKIAEELTGSKGEIVNFGKHKNALELAPNRSLWSVNARAKAEAYAKEVGGEVIENGETLYVKTPRKNLIFKNSDGTPKTDVTARLYPLEQVSAKIEAGDKFTLFNKHADEGIEADIAKYNEIQKKIEKKLEEGDFESDEFMQLWKDNETLKNKYEGHAPTKYPYKKEADEGVERYGLTRATTAAFDKVRKHSPVVADALVATETRRREFLGIGNVALSDLALHKPATIDKVFQLHRKAYRTGVEPKGLSAEEQAVSKIYSDYAEKTADIRRDADMEIDGRTAGKNKWYVSDMLNDKTLELFTKSNDSDLVDAAKLRWAEHTHRESKGEVSMSEAMDNINAYVDALGNKDSNYLSIRFGAVRKASGYGLPEGMRETDGFNVLSKYSQRASRDLATFIELESNPRVAGMLKLYDPKTKKLAELQPGDTHLNSKEDVRQAMTFITGQSSNVIYPKINSFVRAVHSGIMGTGTGFRDLVSVPVNTIPYISRWSDLKAALTGVMEHRKNSRDALLYGARQPSLDKIQFNDIKESTDAITSFFQTVATGLRKWQGREWMENTSRDISFSVGKHLIKSYINGAKAGHKPSILFLKKFGTLVEGDITKMSGKELDHAIKTMAANQSDRVQGTYGGRGLPAGINEGAFAPFFSLQKWSVEKSNVIFQDVLKPALKGENFVPLLTYTLGTIATGTMIQKLNELLNDKKGADPTTNEVFKAGSADDYVAWLANVMQLGSFAGILSDAIKATTDISVYGKTPRNVASFPAYTSLTDLTGRTIDLTEAIRNGDDPVKVIMLYATDLMAHNIQLARMLNNRFEDNDKTKALRDLNVYKQMDGAPARDMLTTPNRYLNLDSKEFKKSKDLKESMGQVRGLIKEAFEKSEGNPEEFRRRLTAIKQNSYPTMPSLKTPLKFQDYYQYLVKTKGKEEADSLTQDFIKQNQLNRIKSSMIP